jgi:hypothetical protein
VLERRVRRQDGVVRFHDGCRHLSKQKSGIDFVRLSL